MDTRVAVHDGFEALPASYRKLFLEAAAREGFFFSLPWLTQLSSTSLEGARLRIYGVESSPAGGHGVARLVLPLVNQRASSGIAAMRELAACANFYSSLFGPAIAAGLDDEAVQRDMVLLARAIASEAPAWHTVRLHPMAIDAPVFALCAAAFRQVGMAVQPFFCFGNWYLQVNGRSYQEYAQSLPSRLRNTLARKTRQLDASHKARFVIITDEQDVAEGIDAFERVYRSSWKPSEAHPAFIPGLIRMAAQQGWLRLGVAYVDGEPAAAQLWLVSHGVASIYKLAYDQRYAALSIGSILTARMMEHAIDVDRVREVDYLTGDDDYKRDWMSHRRERWGMVAFNLRTVRGMLAAARHIGGHALKDLWCRRRCTTQTEK
jgi:CelD/BcsL family acetyltransferase involved in cellulose biosynthesis